MDDHAELVSEVAVLTAKQQRLEADVAEMKREVSRISAGVTDITSSIKTLKWLLGAAVPGAPAIGVGLLKLLQGG